MLKGGRERGERGKEKGKNREGKEERRKIDYLGNLKQGIELVCVCVCVSKTIDIFWKYTGETTSWLLLKHRNGDWGRD